jgi:hypothetical protein
LNREPHWHAHCKAALTTALQALTHWYATPIDDCVTIEKSSRGLAWSLVSNVGRQPCAATRSSHAVAGPGRHSDFAVAAKLGFEARLGSCNVVTYSHPIEK